jgi:hypothetical protein
VRWDHRPVGQWTATLFGGVIALAASAAAQVGVEDGREGGFDDHGSYGGAGGLWLEGGGGGVRTARPRVVPDVHRVRRGDTLWDITGRYFGNPWEWPRVWSHNPEVTNPHWIYPDDLIRLKAAGASPDALPGADGRGAASGEPPSSEGTRIRVVQRGPKDHSVRLDDQGYLDREALEQAGVIVGSPEEHMLLSTYDEAYVKFDEGAQVRPGDTYTVFRAIEGQERMDDESGELVRIFGGVRIQSYDPNKRIARAVITDALDPIERGYRVADAPRQFRMVPPRRNAKSLVAEVVAALRPRTLLADQQIIFVNAGAEQGVELGNRFFIMDRGDRWRKSLPMSERFMGATLPATSKTLPSEEDPEVYPSEVIAEARVVDVRRETSALLVTRSLTEVSIGDRAEMGEGF